MPRSGRPKAVLELTDSERDQLRSWSRRRSSAQAQALALRSRIVLACGRGWTTSRSRRRENVSQATVGKWRARFVEFRLDGLSDDPRPGRPANATHWSRAKMARRSGLSKSSTGRIWRVFELKPHCADTFKLSNDPLFVDKVFDVVGLYLNPPVRHEAPTDRVG